MLRSSRIFTQSVQGVKAVSCLRLCTSAPHQSVLSANDLVQRSPPRLQPYLRIMRIDKPIGSWLLYWPCTWSIALAAPPGGMPNLGMLALFGTGAVLMRGAGCVINDMWDKDFDKKVERTRMRPLANGDLTEKQAFMLLTGLLSSSLGILLQMNWLTVGLGASSLSLVCSYPFFKRVTHWPQAVLGLTFNFGAIMGYTACANQFSVAHIIPLYAAGWCWTMIYDTIYAHQDKTDDSLIGVKSTALLFGEDTKKWLSIFSAGMFSSLATLGLLTDQTWPYWVGLSGITGHLTWQLVTLDIHNGKDCWQKFKSNSWLGGFLFAALLLANLVRKEKTSSSKDSEALRTIGTVLDC